MSSNRNAKQEKLVVSVTVKQNGAKFKESGEAN